VKFKQVRLDQMVPVPGSQSGETPHFTAADGYSIELIGNGSAIKITGKDGAQRIVPFSRVVWCDAEDPLQPVEQVPPLLIVPQGANEAGSGRPGKRAS
jgi:hypothetical protein